VLEPQTERNTQIRQELWVSMVSLFRSHLAAMELSGRLSGVKIDELFDIEVFISATTGILSIWINVEDGSGSWNAITNEQTVEPWSMSTDGIITLNGERLEMEFAVERLAAMLLKK
jgi:hypothetical protein